nr:uncharacterized protein CI109_001799 [Kwoniella shandongensis]KAA5529859.1 hypothetical protein CI109_001799 [Kwoniella shandongensis]
MALPVDSMGPLRDSPPPMDYEVGDSKKRRGELQSRTTSDGGGSEEGKSKPQGLISCEACRKGKRRCEPSPLVSPDHPDAARLPCARCRRFATECVRIKAARRKGPAPVAISDAVHGYRRGTPEAIRRLSGLSEVTTMVDSDRQGSTSSLISSLPDHLDQVLPRTVTDTIIGHFFSSIYPLTPCVHRPTFLADLAARRDKSDSVFFALALAVIGATLVQVPRMNMNMDKEQVEVLVRRCLGWSSRICNNTAHVLMTAQANQLALSLRLNEAASYAGLDPIETEIRRRMYWRARPICLRLEDAFDLPLPAEVDDEQITLKGILSGSGVTPLITGFNVVTELVRILNDALILQRRKTPRNMSEIMADLQQVHMMRQKTIDTAEHVPDELKLQKVFDASKAVPAVDWEQKLRERFESYYEGPHASNSYLVMQGNILVTEHMVRLVLLQTRQMLLAQWAMFTPIAPQDFGYEEQAEDIACELLNGLNSLPVDCVATNGPSLVQKMAEA